MASNFLYLFRGGYEAHNALTQEEKVANIKEWEAWLTSLKETGNLVDGLPLSPEGKVMRKSGTLATNGPFAEGAELIGGYTIVSAKDLEEAVALSAGNPHFKFSDGSLEIREIMTMEDIV